MISIDIDVNIIPLSMLFSKILIHLSSSTFVLRDPPIHNATYSSLIVLVKEYKLELYPSVYEWKTCELIIYKSQLFGDHEDKSRGLVGVELHKEQSDKVYQSPHIIKLIKPISRSNRHETKSTERHNCRSW